MNHKLEVGGDRKTAALRLLKEAGDLGELCNTYWSDLSRCVELGEEISYAIDVDVVVLYSDPVKKSDYGRVLSGSTDQVNAAAALLLGDYIVRRMPALLSTATSSQDAAPTGLLIIPPHDAELQRVGLAISEASMQSMHIRPKSVAKLTDSETSRLNQHLNNSHAGVSGSMEAVVELLIKTGLLSNPYKDRGASIELDRLNALEAGRFIGPRKHPWFQGAGIEMLPPRRPATNDAPSEHANYRLLESMADDWHRRLVGVYLSRSGSGPTARKSESLLSDALVLARLQWMNERLSRAPNCKRRLVLVTGSQSLFEAARQVSAGIAGFTDFASAYLRDPRAFMGAKQLVEHPPHQEGHVESKGLTGSDTEFYLADWLSVVLPRFLTQDGFNPPVDGYRFLDTSFKLSFQKPLADDLVKVWEGDGSIGGGLRAIFDFPQGPIQTFENALRRHGDRMNAQAAQSWRRNWAADIRKVVGEIGVSDPAGAVMDLLRRRELASIDALYAKTDVVGAVQLLAPGERMRGLPALRFDEEYLDAQLQCDDLCAQLFRPGRPDQFDLNAMEVALRNTDPSGYHARVLKAYVFACAGLWHQVRPLCRSALLAVDAIPDKRPDDNRRGREAAYLLSVAERRVASSHVGIDHAEAMLKEAERRNHLPSDLRFDSERLAQQVARIQLEYFSRKVDPQANLIELIERAKALARDGLEETPNVVKRWIVRQSITNGLLLSLIANELMIQPARVSGNARGLIKLLSTEQQAPNLNVSPLDIQPVYSDAVSDFVWWVAVAVFGESKQMRDAAKSALELDVERQKDSTSPVTHFERVRQSQLLNLAGIDSQN